MTRKTAAEIEQQIADLNEQLTQVNQRRESMGEVNWAVDQFHDMTCRWNHTDGCGYYYEDDSQFDNVLNKYGAKRMHKVQYLAKKAAAEKALGRAFKNEDEFLLLLQAVYTEG